MKIELPEFKHCPDCGGKVNVIEAEGRKRPVCRECGRIIYVNPIPAACLVVIDNGRVLLTERAFEPHIGMWCLPGGFLEWGESPQDGAKRELFEETGIEALDIELAGVYDSVTGVTRHVLLIAFHTKKWSGLPLAGDDASDVKWFALDEIPELAFKVHEQAIKDVLALKGRYDNSGG